MADYGEIVKIILKEADWNFSAKELEDATAFKLPMSAKNCPGLNVNMVIGSAGDVKLRCYLAEDVKESKRLDIIQVLNALNSQYRYVTLSIDDDGDVLAAYDFNLFNDEPDSVRFAIFSTMVLFTKVADKCIPPIMKAIWAGDDDDDD